ncbi:MAG: flavodoxin family protein [Candidatus Riflebacteria bacterium]|nr:flavodoxin family protein [Candidatus Riflebacteria bacterium]
MKAIAINGSPRSEGNTEALLKGILAPLKEAGWETELVQIGGKPMRGCIACSKCFELQNGKCVIETDSFNLCMAKMLQADAIILGSPTYFTDVTSELKGLIDRAGFVSMANGRAFTGKIGAAAVAVRRGGATHAFDTINHLFQISGMIIPGSTYWNLGKGLDKGDVLKDEEGMNNMHNLGEMINWLGQCIKPNIQKVPKVSFKEG